MSIKNYRLQWWWCVKGIELIAKQVLVTYLQKSWADVFAPPIAHLTDCSLTKGMLPTLFKTAQVLSLLKKPGNYRRISNFNTIFNRPTLQSAHRVGQSTDTAVLKVLDSFYCIVDDKKLTNLISLDISAAFGTINQSSFISYTWYMSRANIVSINIQNKLRRGKK